LHQAGEKNIYKTQTHTAPYLSRNTQLKLNISNEAIFFLLFSEVCGIIIDLLLSPIARTDVKSRELIEHLFVFYINEVNILLC